MSRTVPDDHRRIDALIEGREQHGLPAVGPAAVQRVLPKSRRGGIEHPRGLFHKDGAADGRRTGRDPGVVCRGHRQAARTVGSGLEQQGVGTQPAPAAGYRRRQLHRHIVRGQVRVTGSRDHRVVERHAQVRRHLRFADREPTYHLQLIAARGVRGGVVRRLGIRYQRCFMRTGRSGRRRRGRTGRLCRSAFAIRGRERLGLQQLPRLLRSERCGRRRTRCGIPMCGFAERERSCFDGALRRALYSDRPKGFVGHTRSRTR